MNKQLSILAIAATIAFASCKKDETTTPTTPKPTPPSSAATTPSFGSGDGAVVALVVRTALTTPLGSVDQDVASGVAVFGNLATGAYTDAGKITLNGKELSKQTNNSYVYTNISTSSMLDLSGDITWMVTTPSFTYNAGTTGSTGRGMPKAKGIAGTYTTVDATSAFTLSVDGSVTNSDSVYFQINGPSNYILKRMAPGTTSVTFTAAEVGTLGKSVGCSVIIAPWNHQTKTLGGKTVHVINELALTRTVEIK